MVQSEVSSNREMLKMELGMLRQEYAVLLYGGRMQLYPGVSHLTAPGYKQRALGAGHRKDTVHL